MHTFRNKALFPEIPYRKFLRKYLPNKGFVAEDLDLLVRVYGSDFHTDETGKFMLIECKYKDPRYGFTKLGVAQIKTFGLIDSMLCQADPDGVRYMGYYVIHFSNWEWEDSTFWINEHPVTKDQLIQFFMFEDHKIVSFFDQHLLAGV